MKPCEMRVSHVTFLAMALLASFAADVFGQCVIWRPNPDYVFVSNHRTGEIVRFSRADIALKGDNATGTIIATGLSEGTSDGSPEGMAVDWDGTVILANRFRNHGEVIRFCPGPPEGSQQEILDDGPGVDVVLPDGPTFDLVGNLFINQVVQLVGHPFVTYKAPPIATSFADLTFEIWISDASHVAQSNQALEDALIVSRTSPVLPRELFLLAQDNLALSVGTPHSIQAWSSMMANTFLQDIITDFATAINQGLGTSLATGSFQSLGMAFDSQGDIWVSRHLGPTNIGLVEFTAATNFSAARAVDVRRPDGTFPPDKRLFKLSITPPDPEDPINPGRDTIFLVDCADPALPTGFVYVIDEVTGTTLHTLTDKLGDGTESSFPTGVTTCGSVGVVPVTITSSDPPDGWIDPLSQKDVLGSPTERIKKFTICFSTRVFDWDGTGLTTSAFTVTTTDNSDPDIPPPPALAVQSVEESSSDPSRVTVTLDQPIPFGEWTTLEMRVENACGVKETFWIDVAHLPDDVKQDEKVDVQDATAFGDEVGKASPNRSWWILTATA